MGRAPLGRTSCMATTRASCLTLPQCTNTLCSEGLPRPPADLHRLAVGPPATGRMGAAAGAELARWPRCRSCAQVVLRAFGVAGWKPLAKGVLPVAGLVGGTSRALDTCLWLSEAAAGSSHSPDGAAFAFLQGAAAPRPALLLSELHPP